MLVFIKVQDSAIYVTWSKCKHNLDLTVPMERVDADEHSALWEARCPSSPEVPKGIHTDVQGLALGLLYLGECCP